MTDVLPQGCGVALVTPFQRDGSLDEPALSGMIDHVIEGGVDFIVALGTTGESVSQSREECIHVLRLIHDYTAGRVPLVAGPFGGNATAGIQQRFKDYSEVLALPGYACLMSSVPSYVKPSQEGLYRHFMTVAEASPLPVLLYNVPSRTATHMTPATTLRLAKAGSQIMGIKEASGDMTDGMLLLRDRPSEFRVYSGDDMSALPLMGCGADGVISVIANAYPDTFSEMARMAVAGKLRAARRLNDLLLDMHPPLYTDGNPAGIKAVLQQLGLCEDTVRLPLVGVSDDTRTHLIDEVLRIEASRAPGWV